MPAERREYEMSEAQLKLLLEACRPVMMIATHCGSPNPQQRILDAWEALGRELGFDYMTTEPVRGKGQRFFTAMPTGASDAR